VRNQFLQYHALRKTKAASDEHLQEKISALLVFKVGLRNRLTFSAPGSVVVQSLDTKSHRQIIGLVPTHQHDFELIDGWEGGLGHDSILATGIYQAI
jgi:hypothetical protein